MSPATSDEVSLDTWVALLAGPAPWWTDDEGDRSWGRLLGLAQIGVTVLGVVAIAAATDRSADGALAGLVVATTCLALLSAPAAITAGGVTPRPRSVWLNAAVRIVLLITTWLAIRAALPGWHALWSTPVAGAIGIDIVGTCRQLGWRPRSALWYGRFAASAFHLGIAGALIATLVVTDADTTTIAVQNFVCLHAWAIAAAATIWSVSTLHRIAVEEQATRTSDALEANHRSRAHWLHDDVCAQLQLMSMRITTDDLTKADVLSMLEDLDHHLRLRQLEELFGAGRVSVAEVLQPFIRHAQARGVAIEGVPAFERAATVLPERAARLAARTAGVLTANALNAGATSISFSVEHRGDLLELSIEDNGSGFSLDDVPAGRGLSSLMHDLRPGQLRVSPRPGGGSIVTATVPHPERTTNGFHPAR